MMRNELQRYETISTHNKSREQFWGFRQIHCKQITQQNIIDLIRYNETTSNSLADDNLIMSISYDTFLPISCY